MRSINIIIKLSISFLLTVSLLIGCKGNRSNNSDIVLTDDSSIKELVERQIGESKYSISIPADYRIEEKKGDDFYVYHFAPMDTTIEASFNGGIYFGNHPSRFSFSNDSCKKEISKSRILYQDADWFIYNCNDKYSIQTVILSYCGEGWNELIHAFGYAKSNTDLINLLSVFETLKKNEQGKNFVELIENPTRYDTLEYKYWEAFSDLERNMVLKSEKVAKDAIKYYNCQFIASDDDATFELLDELTSVQSDAGIKAFYFYLFNKIMMSSDGALAEVMSNYATNIFMSNIPYLLEYFTVNNISMVRYGELLGEAFYYEQEGVSDLRYTFSQSKEEIKKELNDSSKYDKLLSCFYEIIDNMMNKMD